MRPSSRISLSRTTEFFRELLKLIESPRDAGFFVVRPAGRIYLEVEVLYTPGKGKC